MLKNGDKDAFNKLIFYYQNDLYRIARSRLKNDDDAYDAIQETVLSAYNSINKLINISNFKVWLIRILINKCNDIYKSKNKFRDVSYKLYSEKNYESNSYQMESNLEINSLMSFLNDEERTILIMYYVQGYKSREIAKCLKIKESAIRMKIFRAKEKLKKNIKEVFENE